MNRTVLYIEDNADNIYLMQRIVKRRPDVDLIAAQTGAEGLRLAHEIRPALILLDRRLPDMPGNEVLTQLKAGNDTATIPVVVLSGDAAEDHAADVLNHGAEEFIAKPFEIHQIVALLDRFCAPQT
jgi:CheY-like chemotaxis protein